MTYYRCPVCGREDWRKDATIIRCLNCHEMVHPYVPTEWSPAFEILMRSRLLIGAIRYGRMGSSSKPKYDRISAAIERLKVYTETGNLEMLVDVANFMMLEFVEGRHPKRCLYVHVDSAKVRKERL